MNDIARSIIKRRYLQKEEHTDEGYDYANATEIYLAFNSGNTEQILKQGQILNAHQVTQGATFNDDLSLRTKLEDGLIDLQLEKYHDLRPKYAYVFPKGYPEYPQTTIIPGYGNIFARVKNHVKDRTTFTIGDSMDEGRNTLHTFYYRKKIPVTYKVSQIRYWEAQIWGQLNLSDIDFFIVNCDGLPKTSQQAIKAMLDRGLQVFFCKTSQLRQEIAPAEKITSFEVVKNQFLETDDLRKPAINDVRYFFNDKKLTILFRATDDIGLNFCQIKTYHHAKMYWDSEITFSKINQRSADCIFEIKKYRLPLDITINVKDWYGNQNTVLKRITL